MRIGILSDIHEDIGFLKKAIRRINQRGCDLRVCLGDISGFSDTFYRYRKTRNASACLDVIRRNCEIIVPGNHDLHAAGRINAEPAGSRPEYWQHEEDLDPGYSEEDISFLAGLPDYVILPAGDYSILLSHYIEPNLNGIFRGFYATGKEFSAHFRWMEEQNCKLGFSGHAHVRGFYIVTPGHFRHNGYRRVRLSTFPAVIGIPPVTRLKYRSGFCIFDTESYLLQVFKLY